MKTVLRQSVLLSLMIITIFLFDACVDKHDKNDDDKKKDTKTDQQNKQAMTGPYEDIIDLSKHVDEIKYGTLKIEMSRYTVLVDSATILDETLETFHKNGINALKAKVLDIAAKNKYTGRYLKAIKIIYGMNPNNKKMNLYYQPILLIDPNPANQTLNVEYSVVSDTVYYKYVNSSPYFVRVDSNIVIGAASYYMDHITFKRNDNRYYRRFNDRNDSLGDVKSIIYPTQEIDSILEANNSDEILLFNAIQNQYVNGVPYLKHSLLLGSEKWKSFLPPLFYRKYGNLSHICPPSCNSATKIYSIK